MSVAGDIKNAIKGKRKGSVFVPSDFLHLGSRSAVDKTLSRLDKDGFIKRICRGVYLKPQKHSKLGDILPPADSVANAIARQNGYRLQKSGASAANALGLTQQVPAKLVYYTDGPNRDVSYGNIKIYFKHVSPKQLMYAGDFCGHILQAIRYLGQDNINNQIILQLTSRVVSSDVRKLQVAASLQPNWIRVIIRQISEQGSDNSGKSIEWYAYKNNA